jgi:pyruvate/2-oxoglutarate/acetoin dehydrogenase E1 component
MGGRRGYGPTHSQTLEKLFLGVPGLVILAPSDLGEPGRLLKTAVELKDPVLFIENKLLYLEKIQTVHSLNEFEIDNGFHKTGLPCYSLKIKGAPDPQVTLVAYGYMATLARDAMLRLAYEEEIFSELIIPTQLSPFDLEQVILSTSKTGRLVTIEEGTLSLGWGAEVLSRVSGGIGSRLVGTARVAAVDSPVPASDSLEETVLPDLKMIMFTVKDLMISPLTNEWVK